MKFTLTVVHDDDANKVVDALTEHGFYVARLASTGGFLRRQHRASEWHRR